MSLPPAREGSQAARSQQWVAEGRLLLGGEPASALALANRALAAARECGEPHPEAAAARLRGQALRVLGRHTEAIAAFEAAANCAERANDPLLAAVVQIGSIDSLGMLARYEDAKALGEALVRRLEASDARVDAARALANLGSVEFRRDRLAAALHYYDRASRVLERSAEPLLTAGIWVNSANVLTQLGQVEKAAPLYEQAASLYSGIGREAEGAVVATNLGYLHFVSGRPARALISFASAQTAFARAGRSQDAARCDIDSAQAYRVLNLLPEARECYDRALSALDPLELEYDRARALLGRAEILASEGETRSAIEGIDAAAGIFAAQRNAVQQAQCRLTRASLLMPIVGRLDEALADASAAARTFSRAGLAGWAAEARWIQAEHGLRSSDAQLRQSSVRLMRAVCRSAVRSRRAGLESRAEHSLGAFYRRSGRPGLACNRLRRAVEAIESARGRIAPEWMHSAFLRDKQGAYVELVELLLERGRPGDLEEALACVERSRSRLLSERIRDALAGGERTNASRIPALLRERVERTRAELCQAQAEEDAGRPGGSPLPTTRRLEHIPAESLDRLEQEYLDALRQVDLHTAPNTLSNGAPPTLGQLRQALQPGEALIEFFQTAGSVCAFAVTDVGLQAYPQLCDLAELRRLLRRLRYHLHKPELRHLLPHGPVSNREAVEAVLGRLFRLLLQPVIAVLPAYDKLVIVPHGLLHGLPFHALHDGMQYALDRWEVLYAPSASVWHAGIGREQEREAVRGTSLDPPLLMGMALPGIEQAVAEVETIGGALPGARVRLNQDATVEQFRSLAPSSGMIHLATHARFRPDNPLFSALQLADGWLLARDLYDMNLQCRLATLSACRTGLAEVEAGDELFGLVRAFLAAGATSVAASLWPVHDASTRSMMVEFHRSLARPGATRASALRCAQQSVRSEYPHPYYWAVFALVGNR